MNNSNNDIIQKIDFPIELLPSFEERYSYYRLCESQKDEQLQGQSDIEFQILDFQFSCISY